MRFFLMLMATFVAAIPKQTTGQQAVTEKGNCAYCSVFNTFVAEAVARRDIYSVEKLRHDLQQMTTLSEAERQHIEKSIDDAITRIKSARAPSKASARESAINTALDTGSNAQFSLVAEPTVVESSTVQQKDDANDGPTDEDQFEYCQRVISFAKVQHDSIAIDNLEKRVKEFKRLTKTQCDQLKQMILESRKTDEQQLPVHEQAVFSLFDAGSSSNFVESSRSFSQSVGPEDSVVDAVPATGDANSSLALPPDAKGVFSPHYLRIRQRYLDYFFFEGMTATELEVKLTDGKLVLDKNAVVSANFGDQTLHMGQAMLAFAGEAKVLSSRGISSAPSEAAIEILLDAFEKLDAADTDIYGASKEGFFVRTIIHDKDRRGVPDTWQIISDMNESIKPEGNKAQNAMSLDQATSLFVGWWAITKWSGNAESVARAKKQIDSVMKYLMDSEFLIRLPSGGSIDRGPEFRYAAGFLCQIATRATGTAYYLANSNISLFTIKGDPIRFRDDNLGEYEIPSYKIPASMPVTVSHPAVLALKPIGLIGLTAPPKIAIRITDLTAR